MNKNIYKEKNSIPYTYLIGWSKLKVYYYGVKYSKNANPETLWINYFTSSKHVANFRKLNGEPDIIKICKTFSISEDAINYESTILNKLYLILKNKNLFCNWLNKKYDIKAIHPEAALRGSKTKKPWKVNDKRKQLHSIRMKTDKKCQEQIFKNLNKMNSEECREKARKTKEEFKNNNPEIYKKLCSDRTVKIMKTIKEKGNVHPTWLTREDGIQMAKQNNSNATCPHCGKIGQYRAMKRWHFDNCKLKGETS